MIRVTNIERFATHDGPGIRTTIFFKGCHMHCPWCANPETWSQKVELLHDEKKCVHCQMCRTVCPASAIAFPEGKWQIDRSCCKGCQACAQECLNDAITFSGTDYTEDELVDIAMKDWDFYEESGGGVTLSGGEVFMQPEGLKTLLKKLKAQSLHVALETTGSYAPAMLREVVDDVDLFLMDLKHLDAGKLNAITGGNGELVVANFRYLAKNHPEKIVIRMPVIPGFNDESETIEAVLDFAASNRIQEVDLLPFHPLGASKWKNLGRPYAYEKEKMMEKQKLEPYIETGAKKGVKVRVGG